MRVLIPVLAALLAVASGCSTDRNPIAPVAPDSTARYRVTFTATWSAATHPVDFPSNAHFSGLIGGTHASGVVFWRAGQLASPGIQAMAEQGLKSPLDAEVTTAIAAGTAQHLLSGGAVGVSPGSTSLEFDITVTHPLVTLVSMIAPSPDWFVGVADLPLLQSDRWVDSLVVELRGWDAGTDDGATFVAPDAPSVPHVPIAALGGPIFVVGGETPKLGTFTFVRR